MALGREHELHRRRFGRNMGLLAALAGLVAIVFGMTVVKISNGGLMEGYDHAPQTSALPVTEPRP